MTAYARTDPHPRAGRPGGAGSLPGERPAWTGFVTIKRERSEAEIAAWRAGDAERNERARIERLRRDGARSPSENLAEGIALIRFAHRFAGAAKRAMQ